MRCFRWPRKKDGSGPHAEVVFILGIGKEMADDSSYATGNSATSPATIYEALRIDRASTRHDISSRPLIVYLVR